MGFNQYERLWVNFFLQICIAFFFNERRNAILILHINTFNIFLFWKYYKINIILQKTNTQLFTELYIYIIY